MIEMSFEQSDERVVLFLQERGSAIIASLRRQMDVEMISMQGDVAANKLSGQVLRNRTGTLRRATTEAVEQDDVAITGIVGTDPTAPYGKVHEYGGSFMVRAHLRRSAHAIATWVRAHTAVYPMRSYLRTTLAERTPGIVERLNGAAAAAAGGGV